MKLCGRMAASQVDWVVSLAIFMIYVGWFFVYLQPFTAQPAGQESLLRIANDGFVGNVTWQVDVVPLMAFSNVSGNDEPIIADFPYSWNSSSFAFSDNTSFFRDEGRLFFMRNLTSGKNVMELVHSSESYGSPVPQQRVIASSQDFVSVPGMRAGFIGSSLDSVAFRDRVVLSAFNLSLNSGRVSAKNITYTSTPFLAAYKVESQLFNHTSYVFAGNSRIYSIVRANADASGHNFSVSSSVANFTDYFSDARSGSISLNGSCISFQSNYADLYDSVSGVSFIFRDAANMSICRSNSSMSFSAYLPLADGLQYLIFMHAGSFNSTLTYRSPYAARFGAVDRQSGVSSSRIALLNQTSYSALKSGWGYPLSREVSFSVVNDSYVELYRYEPMRPDPTADVFVDSFEAHMLDQYGGRSRVKVRVKGW